MCTPHKPGVSSAKCQGCCPGTCHKCGRTWVVVGCLGNLALFERREQGGADLIPIGQGIVPDSLNALIVLLERSYAQKRFDQVLLVGSQSDMRWIYSLLPEAIKLSVVAEICYSINTDWWKNGVQMKQLGEALSKLLKT